jgi:hypothetical protein
VTTRTRRRYPVSAHAKTSWVNTSWLSQNSSIRLRRLSKTAVEIGWLPGCHQMASWLVGSFTKYLSFGERPVCFPVSAVKAPVDTIAASLRRMACS